MASIDRTAYPRFKRVVPVRELNEAFTPTADEVAWAVDRSLGDSNLLSLVVLLKSYQRLGYFPNITEVPASVVEHIRGELGLAIGVDRASEAERTLKRQRDLVREHLGMVYEPKRVLQVAEAAIRKAVQTKDNPPDLVNVALEELVRGRCELPGYSTLDRLAATIRTEVNSGLFDTVAARLDHAARSKLESLLLVDPASRRSEFDNLKSWAQAPSLGKFRARLLHLQGLDGLGPTEQWLADVPPAKIAHFSGQARVTDVGDLRKAGEAKKWTLLISLIHTCRTATRDEVATMFCKRMAGIHKKGREHLAELRETHRAESERLMGVFGDVLSVVREAVTGPGPDPAVEGSAAETGPTSESVTERAGRLVLKTLARAGGLDALSSAHEAVAAHHGNNYLPLLERYYRVNRSAFVHPAGHRRVGSHDRGPQRAGRGGVHPREPGSDR